MPANRVGPDVETVQDVIENLLRRIDFLPYEAELAYGNITEEEFRVIAEEYLANTQVNTDELCNKIRTIYPYIKNRERLGSESFSILFNTDISVTQTAVLHLINEASETQTIGERSD